MSNISNKLVQCVGTKGNGVARTDGKPTKAYRAWTDMLRRCYDPKHSSRFPTYIGRSVSNEWLFFPTFNAWYDENYVEGWQLDKDLLVSDNKVYSPHTCVFVPQPLNVLFNDSGRARGEFPLGVDLHKQSGKFRAQLKIDGKVKHLGLFDYADEAHQAYLTAKKENVIRVANIWKDKIPIKLYDALIRKANDLI